jgi:hypothetical protein
MNIISCDIFNPTPGRVCGLPHLLETGDSQPGINPVEGAGFTRSHPFLGRIDVYQIRENPCSPEGKSRFGSGYRGKRPI